MKKNLLKLVVLAFAASTLYATAQDKPHGQMDPAKQQEMFAKMKQSKAEGLQARISIMQTALTCVNSATNHDQMKTCHQKEHEAMKELGKSHKEKMEAAGMKPHHGRGPKHGQGAGQSSAQGQNPSEHKH